MLYSGKGGFWKCWGIYIPWSERVWRRDFGGLDVWFGRECGEKNSERVLTVQYSFWIVDVTILGCYYTAVCS